MHRVRTIVGGLQSHVERAARPAASLPRRPQSQQGPRPAGARRDSATTGTLRGIWTGTRVRETAASHTSAVAPESPRVLAAYNEIDAIDWDRALPRLTSVAVAGVLVGGGALALGVMAPWVLLGILATVAAGVGLLYLTLAVRHDFAGARGWGRVLPRASGGQAAARAFHDAGDAAVNWCLPMRVMQLDDAGRYHVQRWAGNVCNWLRG